MSTPTGRHRAPQGRGSGHHGSRRKHREMVFSVWEIIIMILFGTVGVLMVLGAHYIGGRRARHDHESKYSVPTGRAAASADQNRVVRDQVLLAVQPRHAAGTGTDEGAAARNTCSEDH